MNKNISKLLKKTITDMEKIYQSSEKNFLSEDDFKCTLFYLFEKNIDSMNLSKQLSTHTEVSLYGESGKLEYRPDLVILKNKHLKIKDNNFKWEISDKGVALIIEIKFIKSKISSILKKEIKKDLKKLSILSKDNKNAKTILFCFDFTSSQLENIKLSSKDTKVEIQYIPRENI